MGVPDPTKVSLEQPAQTPMGEDDAFLRRKKTLNLLIAGLVVLLLPLLGILFIMRNKTSDGSSSLSNMYLFQKRKGADAIVPVTTAAPNKASMSQSSLMMPSEGASAGAGVQSMQGGLGFIRGGEDYAEEPVAPPAPAESEKKEEKKEETPPVEETKAQLGTATADLPPPPKMVERPKLKFTGRSEAGSFAKPRMSDNIQSKSIESQAGATGPGGAAGAGGSSGGGSALGGGGKTAGGMPPGMPAGGMPDMSQMMKNMPGGGAGMPDMSQMMKNMPGGGAGGMPDMSQMMKNMPGGGAGGMPDMSQLMKGMAPGAAAPAADTKTKTKTTKKKTTTGQ